MNENPTHKPLNFPANRDAIIQRAMDAEDGSCSTGVPPPFRWSGRGIRVDGDKVWFQAEDGSEHGWPQLNEYEANRLATFLGGTP